MVYFVWSLLLFLFSFCLSSSPLFKGEENPSWRWLPRTYDISAQFGSSFLPNGRSIFFSFSLTLHDTRRERAYSVSRIRDMYFDTRLGRYYLLVAYGIRVVAILLIGRRPESDWTRIQRDANFPADVIPVKLKERVIRWKDRWYAREANRFYIFLMYETKYIFQITK